MSSRASKPSALSPIQQQVRPLETYLASCSIDSHLLHLIKYRASQINGCAFCLAMHSRDARNEGEREDRLHVLSAWRETDWFTSRERAALAFTEAVTTLDGQHVPDDVFSQARAEFSESELADLTLAIATINVWNRICVTWQISPQHFVIENEAAADVVR